MHKLKGEIQKINKCMLVNLQYIFAGFLHGLKENLSGSDLRILTKGRAITASRKVWVDRLPFSILPCRWQVKKKIGKTFMNISIIYKATGYIISKK